ncbi:MAG: GNAT family N-acetyltransferase [Syntrophales bacterium]|nr:GNAT family N-acetyltransferase [Syntrophales bacterium]
MPATFQTELCLPLAAKMLPLAQNFVRGLALVAGLPEDVAESLALVAREACENSIEHAFEGEDPGTLKLVGEVTPSTLTLSLYDQGLPFYQTQEPGAPRPGPENPAPTNLPCGGMASIQQCFDEVQWFYHGVAGNELRLIKNLDGVCLLQDPESVISLPHTESIRGAAPGNYAIRLLRPGDGIHVARLMYRVYGYSYSNEDFYYPERLDHDLATGRHVGVVAVAGDGEIAGHSGVERPDLGPLAELGQLAVAPAHRGQGLRKLMGDLLQEEIKRLGLVGLFAEAVTIHTISQEGSDSRGLHATGIKLLDWQAHFKTLQRRRPPSSQWEKEADPGLQRETMVFYFKYLAPGDRIAVCAPSRHREILAKIYGNLGVELHFLEPSGPPGHGELQVHYDQATGVGIIRVNRIGIDTLPEIYQARRDLSEMVGAKVVGLCLPLAQGGTPFLCEAAEEDGFFFSGVLPHFAPDGDFLRLQYLNTELDPERIHLSSPFAKELLTYVLQEKERVAR